MDSTRVNLGRQRFHAALAALAATLLVIGASWHILAADRHAFPAQVAGAAPATTITRAVAGGRDSYADVVKVVAPAVVTIRTAGKAKISATEFAPQNGDELFRRFFGQQFGEQFGRGERSPRPFMEHALGSGVIVSSDGYILTNNHVVDGADEIKIDLTDGRTMTAKVVGTDKPSDLALVKVTATDLHPLALGNSDAVQVGDVVLAVGNPLGIGQTVTMGIISAKGRQTEAGDSYQDFLQTDAPINHGNSGGALVNTKGELVGINSQIASVSDGNIGIGFAIPANMARHVMEALRTSGRVHRGQLGVTIQPVTSDIAESLGMKDVGGVIVSSVEPGSAADRAGLKRDDVIRSFNGQPIPDINALHNRVADTAPGSTVTLGIDRTGTARDLSVTVGEAALKSAQADDRSENGKKGALGLSVAPLTPDLAERAGVPTGVRGLLVRDVSPDGRAADAGIRAGDVIEEVNRQPMRAVDDLTAAVRAASERPVLLLVNRQGHSMFVAVKAS